VLSSSILQKCRNSVLFWVTLSFGLFIFANFWESGVGVSTASYGAIARDMLLTGKYFHPKLAPGIFDPFIEHPYLVLWIDSFLFKIFGVSAQTIRVASSALGILGVVALFQAVRKTIDTNTALLTCLCLLTINVFMNFMASGWLDMPMLAFTLFGFYAACFANTHPVRASLLTGFFLGLSFLSKGIGALGIFPVAFFLLYSTRFNWRVLVYLALSFLLPVAAFTIAHYQSEGFFFWTTYIQKQFVGQNDIQEALSSWAYTLWYPLHTLEFAHLVALFFLPGVYFLWKKNYRGLAYTLLIAILIHALAYSASSRHYRQYVLPIFPWLAVGTAFFLSQKIKLRELVASQILFALAFFYFILTSIAPITVHSMNGRELKAFQNDLIDHPSIKLIYFEGELADQGSWEATSSYISWYFQKTPVLIEKNQTENIYASLKDDEGILIEKDSDFFKVYEQAEEKICLLNDRWLFISSKQNCASLTAKRRVINDKRSVLP
jgi:4-amino-4-deoxy-L-arabinose transferase-like glycosyltransferase